jgi:hypothetical protein
MTETITIVFIAGKTVFIYKRTSASPRGVSLGEKLSHLMEGIEHTYCNTYVRMCSVRACVTWLVLLCLFCLSGVTSHDRAGGRGLARAGAIALRICSWGWVEDDTDGA